MILPMAVCRKLVWTKIRLAGSKEAPFIRISLGRKYECVATGEVQALLAMAVFQTIVKTNILFIGNM